MLAKTLVLLALTFASFTSAVPAPAAPVVLRQTTPEDIRRRLELKANPERRAPASSDKPIPRSSVAIFSLSAPDGNVRK
jgi:hypothetical protein